MQEDKRKQLLGLTPPKGGCVVDMGGEWVFVLKPLDISTWKMAKKMIDNKQSTEAAVMIINTLAINGSRRASEIPETEVGLYIAIEQAIADLIQPVEYEIKKN